MEQFKVDGELPPALKLGGKVRPINEYSIAYWDETHKKCTIGDRTSREKENVTVSFPVDKNGKLDVEKGQLPAVEQTAAVTNVKFEKEVRLLLGVIKIKDENGEVIGVRLPLLDYNGQLVISIKERDDLRDKETKRVKENGGKQWQQCRREPDAIYRNDPIDKLDGIGIKTRDKLNNVGIVYVSDLSKLDDDKILTIASFDPFLKETKLKCFRTLAMEALDMDAPKPRDFSTEKNPYQARYGDENWENEIDENTAKNTVLNLRNRGTLILL